MILKVSSWQRVTATEKSSSRKTQRMSNSLHELPKSFLAIWWIVKVMWWNKNVAKKVCKKDKSFVSDRFGYQTSSQGVLYVLSQKWVTSNFAGKIKNPWETWRLTGWRNCNGLKTPPFDFVKNAEYKKVTTNSAKKWRSTEQMSWHVPHILSKKAALKLEGGGGGAVKYLVIFSTLPNQFRSFVSLGRCLQTKPLQLDLALSLCFFETNSARALLAQQVKNIMKTWAKTGNENETQTERRAL